MRNTGQVHTSRDCVTSCHRRRGARDVIMQADVVTMTYRSYETTHVENQPPSIIIVVDLGVVVVHVLIRSSHVAAGPARPGSVPPSLSY